MIIPNVTSKQNNRERVTDVYSCLLENNIICLNNEINDSVAGIITAQLLYLESQDPNQPIYMYINSPGGSISAGFAIIDTMNLVKNQIISVGLGRVASMAAIILTSADKRYCTENTEIMIHQPLLNNLAGQATDIRIAAEHITTLKEKLNQILSAKTNKSYEDICDDVERDKWLSSFEALTYGLIDDVLVSKK